MPVARCRGREPQIARAAVTASHASDAPAAAPPVLAPDTGEADYLSLVRRELASLRGGVTAQAWLQAHASDSFATTDHPRIVTTNEWCAHATLVVRLKDGTRALRRAFFSPPPPQSMSLPTSPDSSAVRRYCTLSAVWIEAPTANAVEGTALAQRVRDALLQIYGPVRAAPDDALGLTAMYRRRLPADDGPALNLPFFGSAHWRSAGRWERDSTVIVSAEVREYRSDQVVVVASLPAAQLDAPHPGIEEIRQNEARAIETVGRAATLSGIDGALVSRLLRVVHFGDSSLNHGHPTAEQRQAVDSAAIHVLRDWMAAAQTLDPQRQTAALLAADQVLTVGAFRYLFAQDSAGPSRQAIAELGGAYDYNELGGGFMYTHRFLAWALRLDSLSRAGQLAMLTVLRMGGSAAPGCWDEDMYRWVIARGEPFLKLATDTAVIAETNFVVGDAYGDIVARAARVGGGFEDDERPRQPESDDVRQARALAVDHYRRGLALDSRSPRAREAWRSAWRMLAGLAPTRTRFHCAPD